MSSASTDQSDLFVTSPDGLQLACTATRADGPTQMTVLYVHGLMSAGEFWRPLIDYLRPHLTDIANQVTVDARGHGRSQWPPRTASSGLPALSDDLAAVIDTMSAPIVLVAHSIGVQVVLEYARRHWHQAGRRVGSVVLFNGAGETPQWPALRPFRWAAAPVRPLRRTIADPMNAWAHDHLQRRLCALAGRAKPGRQQLVPAASPVDPRVTADICADVQRFVLDSRTARALAAIPVRVVGAEFDAVVPPGQTHALAARLSNARITIAPGVGHSLPWAHPQTAAVSVWAAIQDLSLRTPPLSPSAESLVAQVL